MNSTSWLKYFEANRLRPAISPASICGQRLRPGLRRAVLRSLRRLQLGESGEGSVIQQARSSRDPALDPAICRSIELYIREENRHGRELAMVIARLGGELLEEHWTSRLFTGGRHLLGLRTKMLTIAAAEVVGVEFYRLLLERVPDASIAGLAAVIVREEERHLQFQRHWVERTLMRGESTSETLYPVAYQAWYMLIQAAAVLVFVGDHAPLLRETGIGKRGFARRCIHRAQETIMLGFSEGITKREQVSLVSKPQVSASDEVGNRVACVGGF